MATRLSHISKRIQTKITVATTFIIGIISLFVFLYFPNKIQTQELQAVNLRAQTIVEMTAFSAAPGLLFGDQTVIEEAITIAVRNREILYINVKDTSDQIAASYSKAALMADISTHPIEREFEIYETSYPAIFDGEVFGIVELGLSLEEVNARVEQSRRVVAQISLVLFVIGMSIMMAVSHFIASPIRSISRTAERIASGDISERAKVASKDEVGLLAESFNHMLDELEIVTYNLEHRQHELEEEVSVRKRYESELLEAKELAEKNARTKTEFLATMSHEIRTPLNGVIGMSEFLLETELDEEQTEFASIIRNSSNALLSIINDILDFSKLEAGQIDLEEYPFELHVCVEEALSLIALKASKKNLELASIVHPGVPPVIDGDITRVRQVLSNLLSNAVKFTQKGEIAVEVSSVSCESAETTQIQFSIRDTGIGIPEDRLDRLFKSFSQVDNSTTRKYGGTGLGLAISKRLVEAMGGQIWLESEREKGTTFHFTIRAKPTTTSKYLVAPDLSSFIGKRVLIVDDNKTNGEFLALKAQQWQLKSQISSSGSAALSILSQDDDFDLAIIDTNMPLMSGLELGGRIKKQYSHIPIILLMPIEKTEPLPEDSHAIILYKPVKRKQLFDSLKFTFDRINAQKEDYRLRYQVIGGTSEISRILVAEDDFKHQQVTLMLLRRLGFKADAVSNGPAALEALRKLEYDVVFMDLHMPLSSGIETAEQIWKDGDHDSRYVIGMGIDVNEEQKKACLDAGMAAVLNKPLRMEELAASLDRAKAVKT